MTISPGPRHRTARSVAIGAVVAIAAVLGLATAASAHVRVNGTDAVQGGYGVLTFRVPTESDTASTVGLTVTFPKDHPIASVSTQPVPGWTATVSTAKLDTPITTDDGKIDSYVSQVEWKADSTADGIAPGEFQEFAVSAGPLPETAQLTLPALQSYSDGSTVDWNQSSEGGAEPDHPAPVLQLTAADAAAASHSGQSHGSDVTASATMTHEMAADSTGATLGVVGIVIGALGLLVAIVALLRGARTAPGKP